MRIKTSRAALAFVAAFVAAMTLAAAPALASTRPSPGVTIHPSAITAHPGARSNCPWNGGVVICQYGVTGPYVFPNGQAEYWAIGTNSQVWTYFDDSHGVWHWASLGGIATSGVVAAGYGSGWGVVIDVWGKGHTAIYCDTRADSQFGGWGGWKAC